MPYNFVPNSFHTGVTAERKSMISHQRGHFDPKFHLRLIGKRAVVFLLALIELFSLGVTAEEL